jgi:hypothetical protein
MACVAGNILKIEIFPWLWAIKKAFSPHDGSHGVLLPAAVCFFHGSGS